MSSQHDSKRVLISQHFSITRGNNNKGKPSLNRGPTPAGYSASMPADRVSPEIAATPASRTSSFPAVPDDVQAQLLQVGMRARKSVSDGYKQPCSFPSYNPNPQAPIFEDYEESTMPSLSHSAASSYEDESRLGQQKRSRNDFEPEGELQSAATKISYIPPVEHQQKPLENDFENAPFLMSKDSL
jgi:hypothetical protein